MTVSVITDASLRPMNILIAVTIVCASVDSSAALGLKHSDDPLSDRHYATTCVRPEESSIDNDVTLFREPPAVLWQTHKPSADDLPPIVQANRLVWSRNHNSLEMKYMSDTEALAFVEANFDNSVIDAFKGFPLGVMRADFWRYLVLYIHGGVYADIDVIPKAVLSQWLVGETDWPNCSMVVGQENSVDISQWALAATPKHPALKEVIDLIVARYQEGVKTDYEHFVHYHTGPEVFTTGIHKYASRTSTSCTWNPNNPDQSWVTSGTHMCFMPAGEWRRVIRNDYGSQNQVYTKYFGSWIDERANLTNPNAHKRKEEFPDNVPCRCSAGKPGA